MRLAILGLGLIGGSLARALRTRAAADWTIAAWTPSGRGPRTAVDSGIIDTASRSMQEALAGADIVVLAAPPLDCLALIDSLPELRSSLAAGAVITDVASTKRAIVDRAAAAGLPFVGGHPMAGREATGYDAADADLFVGRPWVVCAGDADDDRVARVEGLAAAVGAVPIRMDAASHDAAVAAISHLPLVVSAALVESVLGAHDPVSDATRLAASGWRDMTRLARGDPAMGGGILATNGDLVAERIRALRAVLDGWLADLQRSGGADPARAEARFAAARRLLDDG